MLICRWGIYEICWSLDQVPAGQFDPNNVDQMPGLYMQIVLFSIAIGAVLFLLSYKTGKWEKLAEAEK